MNEKKGFIIYCDQIDVLSNLTDTQLGKLFRAFLEYNVNNTIPSFNDPFVKFAFDFYKVMFDRDSNRYEEKCKKYSENAKKRYTATASDGIQSQAMASDGKRPQVKEIEIETEKELKKEKEKDQSPLPPKGAKSDLSDLSDYSSSFTEITDADLEQGEKASRNSDYPKIAFSIPPEPEWVQSFAEKLGSEYSMEEFMGQYNGQNWKISGSQVKNWMSLFKTCHLGRCEKVWNKPFSDSRSEEYRKRIIGYWNDEYNLRFYYGIDSYFSEMFDKYFKAKWERENNQKWAV